MKQGIFLLLTLFFTGMANAQCPEVGTPVPTSKIMNASAAKDYTDCDIIIEASFLLPSVPNYNHPGKFKKGIVFQASPIGQEDSYTGGMGQWGLFVVVPKEDSDAIYKLSKGDKLKIRGNTYVRYGIVYFVASSFEVIK